MQVSELNSYCRHRGWVVSGVFQDVMSGTSMARPGMDALMTAAKRREIDIVLTWKLDRFGRSLRHLVTALAELDAVGAQFVSLKDNIDLTTPAGKFQAQVLGAVAEFEAGMIRERVKSGLDRAREKGVALGRPRELDWEKVRSMFAGGMSRKRIAKDLNVSRTAIRKILNAVS